MTCWVILNTAVSYITSPILPPWFIIISEHVCDPNSWLERSFSVSASQIGPVRESWVSAYLNFSFCPFLWLSQHKLKAGICVEAEVKLDLMSGKMGVFRSGESTKGQWILIQLWQTWPVHLCFASRYLICSMSCMVLLLVFENPVKLCIWSHLQTGAERGCLYTH